jgi:cell division protein FtsN
MARDYKPRTNKRRRQNQSGSNIAWWRWILAALIIIGFGYFLSSLSDTAPEKTPVTQVTPLPVKPKKPVKKAPEKKVKVEPELVEPQFDFYEILEDKEIKIPEYEVKTRVKEEKVGKVSKAKSAQYILQVGAFREYNQADKLKARLAFMGIESKIEKAKVGNVVWNRLKIGPYAKLSTIERVRSRLKQKGISTIVVEEKR